MFNKKSILLYVNFFLVSIIILISGVYLGEKNYFPSIGGNSNYDTSSYNNIRSIIQTHYFDKNLKESDLYYSSIKGMVDSLNDPATVFFSPDEQKKFEASTAGNTFAGVGLELGFKDSKIIIKRVLKNTPASNAVGLKAGDEILSIDSHPLIDSGKEGTDLIEYTKELIRGNPKTDVKLTLKDSLNNNVNVYNLKREPIHVEGMSVESINSNGSTIDIFTISRFTEDSLATWKSEWDSSVKQINKDNPSALIIDLRGNPGGFFEGAIYSLADLLPQNTLVAMEEDRDGNKNKFYTESSPRLNKDLKIYILIDGNSASASEIFSGALQYYKRASIVGTSSYGKGTAQEVINFSNDGSSLHLTIFHWLLPSGRWINPKESIVPDYKIEINKDDVLKGIDPQMEKALSLARGNS